MSSFPGRLAGYVCGLFTFLYIQKGGGCVGFYQLFWPILAAFSCIFALLLAFFCSVLKISFPRFLVVFFFAWGVLFGTFIYIFLLVSFCDPFSYFCLPSMVLFVLYLCTASTSYIPFLVLILPFLWPFWSFFRSWTSKFLFVLYLCTVCTSYIPFMVFILIFVYLFSFFRPFLFGSFYTSVVLCTCILYYSPL